MSYFKKNVRKEVWSLVVVKQNRIFQIIVLEESLSVPGLSFLQIPNLSILRARASENHKKIFSNPTFLMFCSVRRPKKFYKIINIL